MPQRLFPVLFAQIFPFFRQNGKKSGISEKISQVYLVLF